MSELNEKIRQQLMEWAEPDFGTFSAGLIPGEKHRSKAAITSFLCKRISKRRLADLPFTGIG